jgi:hypothetical protein
MRFSLFEKLGFECLCKILCFFGEKLLGLADSY